jgi:hypothetical protein
MAYVTHFDVSAFVGEWRRRVLYRLMILKFYRPMQAL